MTSHDRYSCICLFYWSFLSPNDACSVVFESRGERLGSVCRYSVFVTGRLEGLPFRFLEKKCTLKERICSPGACAGAVLNRAAGLMARFQVLKLALPSHRVRPRWAAYVLHVFESSLPSHNASPLQRYPDPQLAPFGYRLSFMGAAHMQASRQFEH